MDNKERKPDFMDSIVWGMMNGKIVGGIDPLRTHVL